MRTLLALPFVVGCRADDPPVVVDSEGGDLIVDTEPADTEPPAEADTDAHTDVPLDPLVANGSFDAPALEPGGSAWTVDGADPADGWSFAPTTSTGGTAGLARPTSDDFTEVEPLAAPADGDQALWVQAELGDAARLTAPTAVIASLRSAVVATVAPSTTYTVRAAFGRRLGSTLPDHVLFALLTDRATLRTVEVDTTSIPEGGWVEASITWRSTASLHDKPLHVGVTATSTFSEPGSVEVWVDAVRLGAD